MQVEFNICEQFIKIYEKSIDGWIEDGPLTYHQEMELRLGGETREEILRGDIQRLQHWKDKLNENSIPATK